MQIVNISLDNLHSHPSNSNVMPPPLLAKLAQHLKRADRYPPLIVRPMSDMGPDSYQILDGHHRAAALKQIGRHEARCVVWHVDDQEALLLLATLNRLQGRDDPFKRASLLTELNHHLPLEQLAEHLPEQLGQLQALLSLRKLPSTPRPPQPHEEWPVAVHFFLTPEQRQRLDRRLKELGGPREDALMRLVDAPSAASTPHEP